LFCWLEFPAGLQQVVCSLKFELSLQKKKTLLREYGYFTLIS
jgi:hypothetical protein